MERRDGEMERKTKGNGRQNVRVRVRACVLSWRARNHLTSVMDAGCRVKLSAVANGPVIATALHSPRCLQLKGSKNKTGRRPKIETPNQNCSQSFDGISGERGACVTHPLRKKKKKKKQEGREKKKRLNVQTAYAILVLFTGNESWVNFLVPRKELHKQTGHKVTSPFLFSLLVKQILM